MIFNIKQNYSFTNYTNSIFETLVRTKRPSLNVFFLCSLAFFVKKKTVSQSEIVIEKIIFVSVQPRYAVLPPLWRIVSEDSCSVSACRPVRHS